MNCKTQTVMAVGAGYILGRRRKARWAMMLSAAALTGGFGGFTGQLLKRGGKLIGSTDALGKLSPELGEIGDLIRGDLLEIGKTAALTAARGQLDRVSDKLHDRADLIRQAGESNGARAGRDEPDAEPEDAEDAGDAGDAEDFEEADQPEDLDEEPEDAGDSEEAEEPAPRRRRSTATRTGSRARSAVSAPVRRTRR